eukprot:scaffold76875_cov62-Phaeocystis_antarctica.AAC.2
MTRVGRVCAGCPTAARTLASSEEGRRRQCGPCVAKHSTPPRRSTPRGSTRVTNSGGCSTPGPAPPGSSSPGSGSLSGATLTLRLCRSILVGEMREKQLVGPLGPRTSWSPLICTSRVAWRRHLEHRAHSSTHSITAAPPTLRTTPRPASRRRAPIAAGGARGGGHCGGGAGVGGAGGDTGGEGGGGVGGGGEGGGGVGGGEGGAGGDAGGGIGGKTTVETATAICDGAIPRLLEIVPSTDSAVRLLLSAAASGCTCIRQDCNTCVNRAAAQPAPRACSSTSTSVSVSDTSVTAAAPSGTAVTTLSPSGTARTTASSTAPLDSARRGSAWRGAASSRARARRAPMPVLAVQLASLRSHTVQSADICRHTASTLATACSTVPWGCTTTVHACLTTTVTSASLVRVPRLALTSAAVTLPSVGSWTTILIEKPAGAKGGGE